jgi:hypothetical protein
MSPRYSVQPRRANGGPEREREWSSLVAIMDVLLHHQVPSFITCCCQVCGRRRYIPTRSSLVQEHISYRPLGTDKIIPTRKLTADLTSVTAVGCRDITRFLPGRRDARCERRRDTRIRTRDANGYIKACPCPSLAAGRVWHVHATTTSHVQAYAFDKTEEYSGLDVTYLTASSNFMLHPEAKVVVSPLLCKVANFLFFDPGNRLAISGCHLSDHFINYLMADSSRC